MKSLRVLLFCAGTVTAAVHPLSGHQLLVTSVRTGATFPNWSPDGQWISFRLTDEAYWRNQDRMRQVYSTKPADKRPVWIVRPDGSDAHVLEPLRFQMAIDGSRATWKPARRPSP